VVVFSRSLAGHVAGDARDDCFDEIDDAAAVEYHLRTLREPAPRNRNKQQIFSQFSQQLAKTAAERPLLVEAIATAEEPEIRLLAVPALREHPSPKYRALLDKLLQDDDERVRLAATAANDELDVLRADVPK
jgi:HEAT repeat protein